MSGFELQEATIEGIQRAIRSREITAAELARGYLPRIEAYDRAGPSLNAVLATNAERAPRSSIEPSPTRASSPGRSPASRSRSTTTS
jgi:amidase